MSDWGDYTNDFPYDLDDDVGRYSSIDFGDDDDVGWHSPINYVDEYFEPRVYTPDRPDISEPDREITVRTNAFQNSRTVDSRSESGDSDSDSDSDSDDGGNGGNIEDYDARWAHYDAQDSPVDDGDDGAIYGGGYTYDGDEDDDHNYQPALRPRSPHNSQPHDFLCRICYEKIADTVFMPCRHLSFCSVHTLVD